MNAALVGMLAALAWGLHDFIARFASRAIGHVNAVFAVTVIGLLILSGTVIGAAVPVRLSGADLLLPALTGVSFALATLWLYQALSLGPISIVSPIVGAYPVFSVGYAVATGARPALIDWLATVAVVAGVVIVARANAADPRSEEMAPERFVRVLVASGLSSLCFAVSLIAGQAAAPDLGEVQTTWVARFFGLAAVLPFLLRSGGRASAFKPRWLPALLAMGLLDALALGAVIAAGKLEHAELATVTSSGFGVVTVLLAWLILKEHIAPWQWFGIACVFGGVGVLSGHL